jgi:hypothetical protein
MGTNHGKKTVKMPLRKPTKALRRNTGTSISDAQKKTQVKKRSSNKTTVSDSQKYRYTKARKWKS